MRLKRATILCAWLWALHQGVATAASTEVPDRKQPIQIEADTLTVDETTGVSTYSGNVTVDQGSLHLSADEIQIHVQDEEIVRIVALVYPDSSRLARYEQVPRGEDRKVEGAARKIVYHVGDERLEFLGEAVLSQASETTVSGDSVRYDAAAGRVKATSRGGGRVTTTINQPREDEDE